MAYLLALGFVLAGPIYILVCIVGFGFGLLAWNQLGTIWLFMWAIATIVVWRSERMRNLCEQLYPTRKI